MAPQLPPPELPDEPRCLFRASLVCKLWQRLLTDAAFLRRHRRFHRAPPLLGYFFAGEVRGETIPRFITTTPASPFHQQMFDCCPWIPLDCRHGRVLLQKIQGGLGANDFLNSSRGALVGNSVYFMIQMGAKILKYDMAKHHLSVSDPPESCDSGIFIVPTEDNLLGVAGVRGSTLYLWSRKANAEGVEGWIQYRVIELRTLLPVVSLFKTAIVVSFAESVRAIFIWTLDGHFIIDLRSEQARRVSEFGMQYPIVPFMSFYTPDCACRKFPLPVETN